MEDDDFKSQDSILTNLLKPIIEKIPAHKINCKKKGRENFLNQYSLLVDNIDKRSIMLDRVNPIVTIIDKLKLDISNNSKFISESDEQIQSFLFHLELQKAEIDELISEENIKMRFKRNPELEALARNRF